MKKLVYIFIITSLSITCGKSSKCSFESLDKAVDCACEFNSKKKAAEDDQDKLDDLKKEAKLYDESFEKALEDKVFSEEEFLNRLASDCDNAE